MSSAYELLKNEELEMKFQNDNLLITGTIDYRNPEKILNDFFIKIHNKIIENNIKELKVDITNLTFLNSSGIKEFVEWILLIESLDQEKRYKLTFLTNTDYLWQESSISTLVYLNPELIKRIIVK